MDTPASGTHTESDSPTIETAADALASEGEVTLEIAGDTQEGTKCGYSFLVRGEVQSSSVLSTVDPDETVMLLENDTKLLSGTVHGDTAGFLVDGSILAAEFDDPEPTVKVGGAFVDPTQWPTVKEYTGYGPGQESVEDPFPDSGVLGARPGDPLDPEEYVIELVARDIEAPEAYCFDIDGRVVTHSDGATVSDEEDRVYGCLGSDGSAEVVVRGVVTRIDTADGIDFSVRARDDS